MTVRGCFGIAGIGGILCDHLGFVLTSFSKCIVIADSPDVEIYTISEEIHMFVEFGWMKTHKLTIESDSLLAVN
ncbi:hypothetical protein GQ457_18G012240 [Hibiscus cannabinus]